MNHLNSRAFWTDTAERAVKTFAQALLASFGVAAVPVWGLDWLGALGIALTATVLSVLTSIASIGAAQPGTASMVDYEVPLTEDQSSEAERYHEPYGEG